MRVLIDSYNNVMQGMAGGVPMRIKKITKFLRQRNIEVTHFNKWDDKIADYDILHVFKVNIDSYSSVVYAKNINKKVVISSVVPLENERKIALCRLLYKAVPVKTTYRILNDMLELADGIIAQTKKEAEFIEKHYKIGKEKIKVIPNGVNDLLIEEYNKNYNNVKKEIVLCVGRFDRNKNQLSLIRALNNTDIPLVFVGGSIPSEEDYYNLCRKEANSNIKFVGWLDNDSEELMHLYSRAKVVALVSHKEIFGNALIEGGAIGANLVATSELPIEEWGLSNKCIKVNTKKVEDIREAIIKAYNTPVDPKLPIHIQSKFSWDSVTNEYIDLYKDLITK